MSAVYFFTSAMIDPYLVKTKEGAKICYQKNMCTKYSSAATATYVDSKIIEIPIAYINIRRAYTRTACTACC